MSKRHQSRSRNLFYYGVLVLGALVTVFPLLYMVSTALKGQVYVFEYPPRLVPAEPSLQNFATAWNSNRFDRYFANSMIVTVCTTLLVLLLASMMAFAFARYEFPFKRILYAGVLLFMMVPAMTLIVPQFMLASRLNLLNSLAGLVVVYVAQSLPLNTFLLRGFFEQIPVELEEAARMDGASPWTVYTRIILPLSKPALATAAIFAASGAWDEYVWANTVINKLELRTLPVGIAAFQGVHATDWGLVFAASLIAILPVVALYIALQKFFIRGTLSGAIKG